MNFTGGLILVAIAIAMVVLARPADGESAPFLKVWFVGQIYTLTVMTSAVLGVTLAIVTRPF